MKKLYLTFTCLSLLFIYSSAQPGTLDRNFGEEGKTLISTFKGNPSAIITQADGKILMSGTGNYLDSTGSYWLVARFNINGTIDETFGNIGFVINKGTEQTFNSSAAYTIDIQPDKKIIAGGYLDFSETNHEIALIRYTENGSLDSSFDIDGITTINLGEIELVSDIALQSDGKIIVTGYSIVDRIAGPEFPFVARYLPNGTLDESFGDRGIVQKDYGRNIYFYTVAIQKDGKILAAGEDNGLTKDPIMVRYLPNGALDSSFGKNGIATLNLGRQNGMFAAIKDIAIQEDGKIVTAGTSGSNKYLITVARFDGNGILDSSFATNGIYISPDKETISRAQSIAIEKDNDIIIAGGIGDGVNSFMAMRFNKNGIPDSTFGENGIAGTNFANSESGSGTCGTLQKDGKIIVGGGVYAPDFTVNFAMARFNGDLTNSRPTIAQIKRWIRNHILHFEDANTNAAYYVIEKSTASNTAFVPVTKITANAANNNYNYTLPETATQSTYRIKAVNKDNSITYSSPISSSDPAIAGAEVGTFKVYPNPAKHRIAVETSGTVQFRLQNSNGRVLLTQTVNDKGSIDISKLPNGIYYLVNTVNGESLKVVKE